MLHPKNWMKVTPQGLYCEPADLYIDPLSPVDNALITHGHADHARAGHGKVYTTPNTNGIMAIRYGQDHAKQQIELDYGQSIRLPGDVTLRFEPAGHILGSAQALLEYQGGRIVISGDYKRRHDPTCTPFKVTPCDVFVTEATFGLPVFRHPPIEGEVQKLLDSLTLFTHRCHLVGVYALGKCQRVMLALRQLGYHDTLYLHGALINLCDYYQSCGIELGDWQPVSEVDDTRQLAGKIVLAPPSALNDRWSRKLPEVLTSMASGWMQIRARSRQRQVDLPMIISDHCDWHELIQTLEEVNAADVWVTHGREAALVHQANNMGFNAQALSLLGYEEDESA